MISFLLIQGQACRNFAQILHATARPHALPVLLFGMHTDPACMMLQAILHARHTHVQSQQPCFLHTQASWNGMSSFCSMYCWQDSVVSLHAYGYRRTNDKLRCCSCTWTSRCKPLETKGRARVLHVGCQSLSASLDACCNIKTDPDPQQCCIVMNLILRILDPQTCVCTMRNFCNHCLSSAAVTSLSWIWLCTLSWIQLFRFALWCPGQA